MIGDDMDRVRGKKSAGGGSYFSSPKNDVEFIGSGCKTLDLCLGGGGWAENRIANIVGDKSTGKTLLCIEASANFAIKYPKGKIRYREAESAFDQNYADALGMPVSRVDFGAEQIDTVEGMFVDMQAVIKGARGPELYMIDSLDALSDENEMARNMDEGSYGADKAKKLSQLFRRLVRELERKHVTVIIVSQVRDNIGAMFGRKTKRSGGRALDFYASQVLYLAHIGQINRTIKGMKRAVGIKVRAKVDKNKIGLPFRECDFKLRFGYGIDDAEACIDYLKITKGLAALKLGNTDDYLNDLEDMPREAFRRELAALQKAVETSWYELERKIIPTRKKYEV
jgi:protein RecA